MQRSLRCVYICMRVCVCVCVGTMTMLLLGGRKTLQPLLIDDKCLHVVHVLVCACECQCVTACACTPHMAVAKPNNQELENTHRGSWRPDVSRAQNTQQCVFTWRWHVCRVTSVSSVSSIHMDAGPTGRCLITGWDLVLGVCVGV